MTGHCWFVKSQYGTDSTSTTDNTHGAKNVEQWVSAALPQLFVPWANDWYIYIHVLCKIPRCQRRERLSFSPTDSSSKTHRFAGQDQDAIAMTAEWWRCLGDASQRRLRRNKFNFVLWTFPGWPAGMSSEQKKKKKTFSSSVSKTSHDQLQEKLEEHWTWTSPAVCCLREKTINGRWWSPKGKMFVTPLLSLACSCTGDKCNLTTSWCNLVVVFSVIDNTHQNGQYTNNKKKNW